MMMRIGRVFLSGVLVFLAVTASAEYYRYTDENGKVRFTDDVSQIPKSRQNTVEKFESVSGQAAASPSPSDPSFQSDGAVAAGSSGKPVSTKPPLPGSSSFETQAAEFNRMQERLHKTRQALDKEKAELTAQAPAKGATSDEKIAYSFKVEALNAKIDQYTRDLRAFEEKVEAFNNRGKGLER